VVTKLSISDAIQMQQCLRWQWTRSYSEPHQMIACLGCIQGKVFPRITRRWETDNGQVQCVIRRTPNFSSERIASDWMVLYGMRSVGSWGVCLAISPKSRG